MPVRPLEPAPPCGTAIGEIKFLTSTSKLQSPTARMPTNYITMPVSIGILITTATATTITKPSAHAIMNMTILTTPAIGTSSYRLGACVFRRNCWPILSLKSGSLCTTAQTAP